MAKRPSGQISLYSNKKEMYIKILYYMHTNVNIYYVYVLVLFKAILLFIRTNILELYLLYITFPKKVN